MIDPCLIYLVRHAESEPFGSLTQKGFVQADRLVPPLRLLGIESVYSSPYERAVQTIAPFARSRNLPVQIIDALKERTVSNGVIQNFEEILLKSWSDFDFSLPGCESARDCQSRVVGALHRIAEAHSGGTVVVSSHGNAIALFLNHVDPFFGFPDWKGLRNPDVRRVSLENEAWVFDRSFSLQS